MQPVSAWHSLTSPLPLAPTGLCEVAHKSKAMREEAFVFNLRIAPTRAWEGQKFGKSLGLCGRTVR